MQSTHYRAPTGCLPHAHAPVAPRAQANWKLHGHSRLGHGSSPRATTPVARGDRSLPYVHVWPRPTSSKQLVICVYIRRQVPHRPTTGCTGSGRPSLAWSARAPAPERREDRFIANSKMRALRNIRKRTHVEEMRFGVLSSSWSLRQVLPVPICPTLASRSAATR